MRLRDYTRKRRFEATPEPSGADAVAGHRPIFVVQLHHARARHYDFRLEADGVLKSWAVPKGPSLRVGEKRLAVEVEDHPLDYASFEGDIPAGNYGAGHVQVFDHGHWACDGDPLEAIAAGKLDFTLSGEKLHGGWKLVRTSMRGKQTQWLLIKRDDAHAEDREADDLLDANGKRGKARAATTTGARKVGTKNTAPATRARKTTTRKAPSKRNSGAWHERARALQHARDGSVPVEFAPELTVLRAAPPAGDDWLHEIKWDGYRLMVDLADGHAKLRSRGGLDWNETFPEVARAVEALAVADACLDGELVVLDKQGRSDFSELQRVIDGTSKAPLRYLVFDLPGLAGVDLRGSPLHERKALLKSLLGDKPGVLAFSDHVAGHGAEVFAETGRQGIEGVVSKRAGSAYAAGRSGDWIKSKHEQGDEFVIVGYTAPKGARQSFGALLMATRDGGRLRYVGRVGTGFDDATLRRVHAALKRIERKTATLELPGHVPFPVRSVHWVAPRLVAEVAFRGWAKEGLLRQASFKRLRADKRPQDVGGDRGSVTSGKITNGSGSGGNKDSGNKDGDNQGNGRKRSATTSRENAMRITHPDRIVFAGSKFTKGDVADYYQRVAKWMLPELAGRPLSLMRCPDGTGSACFFQKHHADSLGDDVHAIALAQKSGKENYLYVDTLEGVLDLVQMNTLEFHPWGARVDAPERPDRLVFDLDPGDGVRWPAVIAAARDVRARLREAGLESFVRLSGGKGLHVVVPIAPGPDWEQVRVFCDAFARAMATQSPDKYVATMSKAKRPGKIFIDWLRNTRGATSVASWSLRARAGAPVAVPIRWEELGKITKPDAFDLKSARERAAHLRKDPWDGLATLKQVLPEYG